MSPVNDSESRPASSSAAKSSLYAKYVKVYPKDVKGTFRTIRYWLLSIFLSVYFLLPWVRWERGEGMPDQAVLLDIPGRRLYYFFIELWPQQIYFLTGVLVLAAVALFMVTAIAGRIWCGFACPQTIWTDLFLWIERRIEGDRAARQKLDKAPWTVEKFQRKFAKQVLWIAASFLTGTTFCAYVVDAPTLWSNVLTLQATPSNWTFIALFSGLTYVLGGYAREQVCIYMCPWPRFQAAMQDEESYVVTYEEWRGEPRGFQRKAVSWEERQAAGGGDCIDCGLCAQVCPTGIDIRNGNQLACIGCGLCIDACNEVMRKINRPGKLITLDTEVAQVCRAKGEPPRYHPFRPRTLAYAAVLSLVIVVMVVGYLLLPRLDISVQRDRAPLFVMLTDGAVRNTYTFKIVNMDPQPHTYTLTVGGLAGASITMLGQENQWQEKLALTAGPDTVETYRLFVRAPRASVTAASQQLVFTVKTDQGESVHYDSVFMGPESE